MHFAWKSITFRAPAIYTEFSPNNAPATKKNGAARLRKYCSRHEKKVTRQHYQMLRLLRKKVTRQHHQMLRLPRKSQMWVMSERFYSELLWALSYSRRNCYLTELFLDWTVPWQTCSLTELFLDWTLTWLNCSLTDLFLEGTVPWLNCYLTELLLEWTFTALWLDWSVPWLNCYLTELNCYLSGLFAFSNVRTSEVSQLNFLWIVILLVKHTIYIFVSIKTIFPHLFLHFVAYPPPCQPLDI